MNQKVERLVGALLLGMTFSSAQAVTLDGAGSSFAAPLVTKLGDVYRTQTGVGINYQSVGSGAGQKALLERKVDFAGSDVGIAADQVSSFPGKVLTVPLALGAVVPAYNLPGVKTPLRLTGPVLADMLLGKIKTWNDAAIAKLNPTQKLPALPIVVAHRSDSSGTTGVLTDFLSKTSPEWKTRVGQGSRVEWPLGEAVKGNEGMANMVVNTPGALGYLELNYAQRSKISYGSVQNRAGQFVQADASSVAAAANSVPLPRAGVVNLTNAAGAKSYPISTYTYLMVYQEQKYSNRTQEQAQALKKFLNWAVTTGQQQATSLGYVRLPTAVRTRALSTLNTLRYGAARF